MTFLHTFKVTTSSTDDSESDNDSTSCQMENETDSQSCDGSDEEDPYVWNGEGEDFLQDVTNDEPLPEPKCHQSSMQTITILLQWLVYFLLFWQATCKISDNGLEWLLRFMFKFLHSVGITCNSQLLCQMALMFPSSLFLLRKFVRLKRDNFVKFAVCPRCAALYDLTSCIRHVGGQIVSNICTNKPFKKEERNVERLWQGKWS